jgi:CRP-like cAMP-binding protein
MPGTWWPALRAGELIAYLTDDELQRLHAVTVPVLAEPGDVIFYKGAPSKSLIIVEEGEVQAADDDGAGGTTVLGSAGAGSVMGELGFLDGEPRANHVRAATSCRLRKLTRDQLLQLAGEDAVLFGKLVISLAELLAARYRRVVTELEPLRAPDLHEDRSEGAQALDVLKAVALETKNLAEL